MKWNNNQSNLLNPQKFLEQVVCRSGYKMEKKAYLTSVSNIAMWLYHSLAELEITFPLFKEQRQKEAEKEFLDHYVIPYETPKEHVNYLRVIFNGGLGIFGLMPL